LQLRDIEGDRVPRPELRALTGLRGVAACVVALAHLGLKLPFDLQQLFWHNAAVDLFFCLSGFTLCYVYRAPDFRFAPYVKARVARIYPLYFVTLLTTGAIYVVPLVAIDPATYPARTALTDFMLQTLMLNAWPIVGASGVHWNQQAWSISAEWLCYLVLFPLLLQLSAPRSANRRLISLIALPTISYALFATCFDWQLTSAEIHVARSSGAYWLAAARAVTGFTAGWIAFASFAQRDAIFAFCTQRSGMIWLGFAAILLLSWFGVVPSQALLFLFPFMVLAATDPASVSSRLLGWRPLHFLGVISYSIYMTHFIVFLFFVFFLYKAAPPATWSLPMSAAVIAATLAVSFASYSLIERPARDAIRRLQWAHRPADDEIPAHAEAPRALRSDAC
jgi:peptidoglycan/LPS O-acetylase OafA/YrhL